MNSLHLTAYATLDYPPVDDITTSFICPKCLTLAAPYFSEPPKFCGECGSAIKEQAYPHQRPARLTDLGLESGRYVQIMGEYPMALAPLDPDCRVTVNLVNYANPFTANDVSRCLDYFNQTYLPELQAKGEVTVNFGLVVI